MLETINPTEAQQNNLTKSYVVIKSLSNMN